MKNIKHIERLQQLHNLIVDECTGSPTDLAKRMDVSERTIYYLLEQLKDYDAKIGYDRSRRSYFYKSDFVLEVNFSICIGSHDEVMEIMEGSYLHNKNKSRFNRH